jgi:radical SAM superfamily enzyme YgiQ (UPF0313 family)
MNLEEINEMWAKDAKINESDLGNEALKIPLLHNKYYTLYVKEILRIKKLKADLKELEMAKYEYYTGSMAEEDLKARGWKPNQLKIMKSEVSRYIEADKDIINTSLKIDYHSSIASYLEDVIKNINNRNFIIRSALDWSRFQSGGM